MTQVANNDTLVADALRNIVDHASASAVFGAPISRDGVTVLPVAKVSGGGGGGNAPDGGTAGGGAGLGLTAKALGVYVIKDAKVSWRPALDLNKVILGGQIVAVIALFTIRAILKTRRPALVDKPAAVDEQ